MAHVQSLPLSQAIVNLSGGIDAAIAHCKRLADDGCAASSLEELLGCVVVHVRQQNSQLSADVDDAGDGACDTGTTTIPTRPPTRTVARPRVSLAMVTRPGNATVTGSATVRPVSAGLVTGATAGNTQPGHARSHTASDGIAASLRALMSRPMSAASLVSTQTDSRPESAATGDMEPSRTPLLVSRSLQSSR